MYQRYLLLIAVCGIVWLSAPVTIAQQPTQPDRRIELLRSQVQAALNGSTTVAQLNILAEQTEKAAAHAVDPHSRLAAYSLREMLLFKLSNHARDNNDLRELAYRVGQMRTVALMIGRLDCPDARLIGDYWQLQADLFDINAASIDASTRSDLRIERLNRFLDRHPERETAVTGQVMLALLREYDAVGQTGCACDLAEQVRDLFRMHAEVLAGVDKGFKYCEMGNVAVAKDVRGCLDRLLPGSAKSPGYTLIYFYSNWQQAADEVTLVRQYAYKLMQTKSIKTISVDYGASRTSVLRPVERGNSGSTVADRAVVRKLANSLGIISTPRFVLLNDGGQIIASGSKISSLQDAIMVALDKSGRFRDAGDRGGRGSEGQSALAGQ